MNRRLKGLLCFALAIAFAANTLWLFPHADEPRYEYRAVELNESNMHRYIAEHPSVRRCFFEASRTCEFEMRARNEPIALDAKNPELYADYKYIATPDGYFEPTVESRNGTVFVSSQKSISNEGPPGYRVLSDSLDHAVRRSDTERSRGRPRGLVP